MLAYLKKVYTAWIDYPKREGTVFQGKYRIERFLGMGSYGLTYLCQDMHTGDAIVVKQAKPSKGQLGRDLLHREIEILRQLDHPSIPKCLDYYHESKQFYMITEYVKGQTVEDLIFEKGMRFTEHEALRLIRKLMAVVSYIHEHGIVHRDIRIPNVILQGDQIHVIDFGLASRIGEPGQAEWGNDEALMRRRVPEVSSDLYAIGHFLLFMLYSIYESPDLADESAEGWEEELHLTPALKRMIRKLLQTDPAYKSTQEFMAELDALLELTD